MNSRERERERVTSSPRKFYFIKIIAILFCAGFLFCTSTDRVLAATSFTITTPTAAIGAGTPSRAITLTVTGGSVGSSVASFALSDGGIGGVFYPASPVTIPANASAGATTQFVYIAPANATGTITITATATGGITATNTLALPIGTATKFVYDNFTGTAGTNLTSHTPNIGATWINPNWACGGAMYKYLNGTGGAYDSGTGHVCGNWIIPTSASSNEQDVAVTVSNINNTTTIPDVSAFVSNASSLNGYRFLIYQGTYEFVKYSSNSATSLSTGGTVANGSTHTLKIAIRNINGLQYLFPMSDGVVINGPTQDGTFTSGYPGHTAEIPAGQTPASTDSVYSNFTGSNADWTSSSAESLSVLPATIPANHSGNITLTLSGINSNWVQGKTVFAVSGVSNVTKISQNITSTSTATVVITTGAGTGTLTVSDGTVSGTVAVGAATLSISPTGGTPSSTVSLALTGGNTVWTQETPVGLFTVSGGTGASIGTPTVTANTSATAMLTVGSATGTLVITDHSTGATTTFSASAATNFTITTLTAAIGAGTPSRAITLTVTGGSVGSSAASFALSDGGAGGTFYPGSPVTIPANSSVGATTQFVYIAPASATGTITITATATGGITATNALSLPIGTATEFVYDNFTGTAGTNLIGHTPNIGATWIRGNTSGGTMNKLLNGTGGAYDSGTGHVYGTWMIPTAASSTEQDVAVTVSNINNTTNYTDVSADVSNSNAFTGYRLMFAAGSYALLKYINLSATTFFSGIGSVANGSTHTLDLAVRNINGSQYLFPMSDGGLIDGSAGVVQDGTLTSGYPGQMAEIPAGQTPAITSSVSSNFIGYNADWTSNSPATSYTLTGPSSSTENQASSNFTITPNGAYAGIITPSDGGAGGTFTPSSLSFSNSSAAQTFTYTATATGTITISASSSPAITNPSPLTVAVSAAPVLVTFPNANIYESPDIWRTSGTSIISPTGGAYLKFKVTGTQNITANVDTTLNSSLDSYNMPSIKVIINSGTPYYVQFPANSSGNTPVSIASGLNSTTTYSVSLYMIGGNGASGNNDWTGTNSQTKINSLQFDGGSSLSNQSLAGKTCLFYGDSILQAYYGGAPTFGTSTSNEYYSIVDYTQAWPSYLVSSLGCEYSQIGIGSQGWINGGNDGYPAFGSSWGYYDSTHQKTFSSSTAPNYVIIDQGTNDHGQAASSISSQVKSVLTSMRSQFGTNTKIILVTPYNPTFDDSSGNPRLGLISGYNAYETATLDKNTFLVDLSTTAQQYALSPWSLDNIHPDPAAHAQIAGIIGSDIQSELASSSDASLSGLAVSPGILAPSFISSTTSYTASVLNGVSSITVTPTATQGASSTIIVNGSITISGSASAPIALSVGSNTIPIVVTAPDGVTTSTYTITVTRAVAIYTLSYSAGANGTITGSSTQTVAYGSNGTAVTAVPATGYHFVDWSDASTTNPRTDSNVTGNISVTANFATTNVLTITSFSLPATSTTLTVPVTSFTTGEMVAGYYLSESPITPLSTNPGWLMTSVAPALYTFQTAATSATLYAWAQDSSGNVSPVASTTISFPYYAIPATTALNTFVASGIVTSTASSIASTTAITFDYPVVVSIGSATVSIPSGTSLTTASSSDFTTLIATTTVTTSNLSSNSGVLGTIQYGLASSSISLNQLVTIAIPVDPSYDGQTLPVYQSENGGVSWTELTTCPITIGVCSFTTSNLSSFAVVVPMVVSTPSIPSASIATGGGGSDYALSIDNGIATITTSSVMLSLYGTGAYTMELSNTPGFASSTWIPYVTSLPWTLASSTGEQTVFVQYRAVSGSIVGNAQANIDLEAPSTSTTISVSGMSIAQMENLLASLEAQLKALESQASPTTSFVFTRNLSLWSTGNDVKQLQLFLISQNSGSAARKLAVHGATKIFGTLTFNALVEFQ